MKCPNCLNNLNAKFASCPYCRKRMPTPASATIKETEGFQFDERSQPSILRGTLLVFLLISCVIALAVAINFGNADQPKTAASNVENFDKTVTTPEPTVAHSDVNSELVLPAKPALPSAVPQKVMPATKPQTISILSDSIVASVLVSNSRPIIASSTTPINAITKTTVLSDTSNVVPRQKPQSVGRKSIQKELPPAPELAKVNTSNSELRLEVDAGPVVLQKNIGLVSINSYIPARIYIDGQFSGMTPRAVKLVAGEHQISLMAEGYREYSRKVKVDGHQQIGMVASMTRKNTTQVAGVVEE
jgi:PEGA domain